MPAFGIDLGTTTTLIARAYPGKTDEIVESEVLKLKQPGYGDLHNWELNHLPSVAYFPSGGAKEKPIVGLWAKEEGPRKDPTCCVRAVKRLMGQDRFLENVGWTPVQVSALYLEEVLRQIIEQGYTVDDLTVTVPASYTTNQRRDTLRAIDIALERLGLPKASGDQRGRLLISEPVAALLAFVAWDIQREADARQIQHIGAGSKVLVYDIGGGTLDLTLVELGVRTSQSEPSLDDLQFVVLDISRHNLFGGEDFDLRLARDFLYPSLKEAFPALSRLELTDEERLVLRYDLINEAEKLKIGLNEEIGFGEDGIHFNISSLVVREETYDLSVDLSYQQYKSLMASFLEASGAASKNALSPIDEILKTSGIDRAEIDYFLPVGGMSKLLPLHEALKRYWGDEQSFLHFPTPMEAIAKGAAVYSYLKSTYPEFRIEEPAADAYYILLNDGTFDLLLRRHQRKSERHTFHLANASSQLLMEIFAGADPPTDGSVETIYHTLFYQGGMAVPLGKEYPKDTPVYIEIERRYDTKVPVVRVGVGNTSLTEIDFEDL